MHDIWDDGERFRCSCGWVSAFMLTEDDRALAIRQARDHPQSVVEPDIPTRELIRRLRDPSAKMIAAMAKAMSPENRPTEEYISVKQKHRIRFLAAVDQMLEEIGWLNSNGDSHH